MRLNWAVWWAAYQAVYRAVYNAMYWYVYLDVGLDVGLDVDRTMFWAVFDAMRGDPPHPSLDDFLVAEGEGAP